MTYSLSYHNNFDVVDTTFDILQLHAPVSSNTRTLISVFLSKQDSHFSSGYYIINIKIVNIFEITQVFKNCINLLLTAHLITLLLLIGLSSCGVCGGKADFIKRYESAYQASEHVYGSAAYKFSLLQQQQFSFGYRLQSR
uniref:Uncharacterized protein n=1 Tax=Glossina brevipalpis TaxID=37001 RepID=A0A1A9X4R3_9MUSC